MKQKNKIFRLILVFIMFLFLIRSLPLYAASMTDYCVIPPYVKTDIKPNIMIMLDNSQINGGAAYLSSAYDSTVTYAGLYRSDLLYTYSSNRWVPTKAGGLSGNVLNWATTSRYDLIESILVGGKSVSRQTNINTLVGYNSGTWNDKIYTYTAGLITYTCVFRVNIDNKGVLTITDPPGSPGACGLIKSPPVYPQVSFNEQNINSYASLEYTARNHGESPSFIRENHIKNSEGAFEKLLGNIASFFVSDAEAAPPLKITNPKSKTNVSAVQNKLYTLSAGLYVCIAAGGSGNYSWSASGLPSGLTIDSASGVIYGTPTDPLGTITTFSVTVNDGFTTDTVTATITITGAISGSKDFNVQVCAGGYGCSDSTGCNCIDASAGTIIKSGIIPQFWSQAQFGEMDFSSQLAPNVEICLPANNDNNYYNQIENAIPVGDVNNITQLVNGEYEAIQMYRARATSAPSCDPFSGDTTSCRKNFILMITAGEGANNPPSPNSGTPNVFTDTAHCSPSTIPPATYNLSKNSCYGYSNDLRTDLNGVQNVSTYIVNAMGVNGNILSEAATAGGGIYYPVYDPIQLRAELIQAFQDIIARAASGTAASVLASGEGSGANLVQAVFYPRRKFYNPVTKVYQEITWTGRLQNLWFYADPRFTLSNIREDTDSDKILDLPDDYIIRTYFDLTKQNTMASRCRDVNGDGGSVQTAITPDIPFEQLNSLWEAGLMLWSRDIALSPRTIKTTVNGSSLIDFSTVNASTLQSYLNVTNGPDEATAIIRYMNGEDTQTGGNFASNPLTGTFVPNYRSRTIFIDLNGNGAVDAGETNVWKLGDVLDSTPRISSWIQLNTYDSKYSDTTYKNYINSSLYLSRGMVFTGGNDGMLHGIKLGSLQLRWSGQTSTQKAKLLTSNTGSICQPGDTDPCGKEMWAFIPKNALPYLKYSADPNYCHIYSIDLAPYIFDASIGAPGTGDVSGNSRPACTDVSDPTNCTWRTIVIGGMRTGGASKATDANCSTDTPDGVCAPAAAADGTSIGYSSYFALDITDQNNPTLLWEFSDPSLGFSTTGPAIVRIGDKSQNGKWFVVFGSGPTGPIDTTYNQFLAHSDQELKFFVLDLKTGSLLRTISTGITNAFAGSMLNSTHDANLNYQDDAVYTGYVKKCASLLGTVCTTGTWTDGGVGRILTKEDPSPSNWVWSTVLDGIGPVTSSVVKLQDNSNHILWLYFGTGRYYYEESSSVDDPTNQRTLYGVKEPCFTGTNTIDGTCTATVSGLTNVTSISNAPSPTTANDPSFKGWYIYLDPYGSYSYYEGGATSCSGTVTGSSLVTRNYRAERVITDPLATTSGVVFLTTYKPYDDVCALGGKSFIWAVKYNTGGAPGALLQGAVLLQVSTGSIEQKNLSTAFTNPTEPRKTAAMEGVPPTAQGLSILTSPPPVKRMIHIRER